MAQDGGATFTFTGTAKDCLLKDGAAKDVCISMIHSVRAAMKGGRSYGDFRACSPNDIGDMEDTQAVIEWIRRHPERQDKDVNAVAREALSDLYPCS
ncbi:Rap1a/Tai family immunity protein [Dongia soli]|uniref:Rap1a/Tai family immunity protein n=1 Tax=Dongia soli TaxID=600628 RepID=A0ABU5EC76_9PROT|nr:Rap1a/Tai family immunity protein [Dongia soli]MDY0883389.1 Rap1a/Tai family immunity protein [Dongia soli]